MTNILKRVYESIRIRLWDAGLIQRTTYKGRIFHRGQTADTSKQRLYFDDCHGPHAPLDFAPVKYTNNIHTGVCTGAQPIPDGRGGFRCERCGSHVTEDGDLLPLETITDAAIRYPTGEVYIGKRHYRCIEKAKASGKHGRKELFEDGFLTSRRRFVDRAEAKHIAIAAGQIPLDFKGTVYSEDLWRGYL